MSILHKVKSNEKGQCSTSNLLAWQIFFFWTWCFSNTYCYAIDWFRLISSSVVINTILKPFWFWFKNMLHRTVMVMSVFSSSHSHKWWWGSEELYGDNGSSHEVPQTRYVRTEGAVNVLLLQGIHESVVCWTDIIYVCS